MGNRLSTSVGGTLTGRGGNLIIIDDPLKPQDAYSEAARESTKQWYANTLLSRLDDKVNDAIIVVMQRLHTDDLVGHLLEQDGWTHLNLPAIAETKHQIPIGPALCHLRQPGDVLHPEREPRAVLDEFKRSMGSLDFAAQYQQEPVAEGGNLIKWKWFSFYDDPPARQADDRIIISWDTAMSSKELSSYSACARKLTPPRPVPSARSSEKSKTAKRGGPTRKKKRMKSKKRKNPARKPVPPVQPLGPMGA